MSDSIPASRIRSGLSEIVAGVRKGARYTVSYRGRPAFRIVPLDEARGEMAFVGEDSLLGAPPVGRSAARCLPTNFDEVIYGSPRRR